MAAKIKKGDVVEVLAGKDRGKTGEVIRVITKLNKALVKGVAVVSKRVKSSALYPDGACLQESPIHLSNLSVIDSVSGLKTRVGFKILEDGRKVRFAKRSGALIDE